MLLRELVNYTKTLTFSCCYTQLLHISSVHYVHFSVSLLGRITIEVLLLSADRSHAYYVMCGERKCYAQA